MQFWAAVASAGCHWRLLWAASVWDDWLRLHCRVNAPDSGTLWLSVFAVNQRPDCSGRWCFRRVAPVGRSGPTGVREHERLRKLRLVSEAWRLNVD